MRLVSGVYWTPRQEGSGPCADRLSNYLHLLKEIHVVFGSWIPKGVSRKSLKGVTDVSGDCDALKKLFERGVNKTDDSGIVMGDLGFSVGLWNQRSSRQSSSISITCGLYFDQPGMLNNVLFMIPEDICDGNGSGDYSKILSASVTAWNPDWGAIYDPMQLAHESISASKPISGNIAFVSNKLASDELLRDYDTVKEFSSGFLCTK